MKRFVSLVLVLILMFTMISCGSSDDSNTSSASQDETSVDDATAQAEDYFSVLMENDITDYWPVGVPDEIPLCQSVTSGNSYRYEDGTWLLYLLCTMDQVAYWEQRLTKAGFEGSDGVKSNDNYIIEYSYSSDGLADKVKEKGVETMLVITIKSK